MAQFEFTLDDIRQLIEESELRVTKSVNASFAEYELKYDKKFDKIDRRFDKMDVRLDTLTAEMKATRRLVGVHSEEIMELKARTD